MRVSSRPAGPRESENKKSESEKGSVEIEPEKEFDVVDLEDEDDAVKETKNANEIEITKVEKSKDVIVEAVPRYDIGESDQCHRAKNSGNQCFFNAVNERF